MMDLLKTATDLFGFVEKTPDLICIAGKDGFLKQVNPAVIATLGYSYEEIYSLPINSLIHPDDLAATVRTRQDLFEGKTLHNFKNRYITKSGDWVWLDWTSLYFPEKEFVFAIARNVTQQKKDELEVQQQFTKYKGLAKHFKNNIEKDRKYLAYELHEELAQLAAGVKMQLETIPYHMPDLNETALEKLTHAVLNTKLLIKTLQRLSFSISPAMLEQFGLDATLQWLCREFNILTNQQCTYSSDYNEADIIQEVQLDFFRICQEALDNVMQHSKATQVGVGIYEQGGEIRLLITDNGTGFDTSVKNNGAGLVHMRELAVSIGGRLEITSTAAGTSVCVCIGK